MKISFLLMFVLILQISANVNSQNTKLDLSVTDTKVKDVLKIIENQSDYRFFYNYELTDLDKKLTLTSRGRDIKTVLDNIFKNTTTTYKLFDDNVVVIAPRVNLQQRRISGQVTDSDGGPMIGVNVSIKGTTTGVVCDIDGRYTIEVPDGPVTLVFSYVGYLTEEVDVRNESTLDVVLVEDIQNLDEVVVIGYGTAKKSDLTGAVVSANLRDFEKSPNTNLVQSLQGTVPGLNIGQVNSAGATPSISIRGTNTIDGSSSVLIVLDGIIYNGSLESINPNDIKSIDILKDASATAVYGAQAANGVMLITTKRGRPGKARVSFSSSYSIQSPSNKLRTMNREEMLDFVTEVMWDSAYTKESGYTEPNPDFDLASWMTDSYMVDGDGNIISTDFDWWDAATRRGSILENKLSVSGGTEAVSYLVSYGNVDQKNQLLNDDFKRNSVRVNIDANPRPWWKMGVQSFGSFVNKDGAEPTLWTLISMSPLATPYNEDGSLKSLPMETARTNPLMGSDVDDRERQNYFFGNIYSEFRLPIEGLTYRFNFGNNYRVNEHFQANEYGNAETGEAYKQNSAYYDYTFDNIVNYTKEFGPHEINATFVYGAIERKYTYAEAKSNTFSRLTLGYNSLKQGTNQFAASEAWSEALLYQMARMNYKFKNRYLVTATIRKDGFSGFAENYKSAYFPSVALGWIVSEENFFNVPWVNYLKFRTGYGVSGNQVGRYESLAKVDAQGGYVFGDGGTTIIRQELTSLENKDLKWEKTKGVNLGLDFNLLSGRVNGSIEYYSTTTTDLLFKVKIPSITGFKEIISNVGEIKNHGIEFNISSVNIRSHNFEWTTTFNISSNKNKIITLTGLDNDGDGKEDDFESSRLFIGESLSAIYEYKVDGIYQLDDDIPTGFYPGTYKIINTDDEPEISPDDRVIIGKRDPAYRLGILNKFSYKNISLSFFINSIQGGKDGYLGENSYSIGQDDNARRLNRISEQAKYFWSPRNPDGIYASSPTAARITPTVYQDRSFIRLQDVTLSYSLPKSLLSSIGIEDINVYVNGKNLFIITDWKGWDPEANYGTSGDFNKSGSDYDARPVMRGFTTGINITF